MGLGGAVDLPAIRQRILVDDGPLSGLGARFGKIGGMLGKAVAVGAGAAAAGVAGFAAVGVKGAIDVERGIAEVVTLFGETGEAAGALGQELSSGVADLSNEVGIAQDVLVGGLYQAISAGVPKDNAFEFLRIASKASIAGVTDVETAVDGMTSTLNAFGLDASEAENVADSMFAAVAGGKTTFEEISSSIATVAPAAAAAGVSFEEINAGIATLTAGGKSTSEATTMMRAAFTGLQRPSEELNSIFQAAGYESAEAALAQDGLAAALGVVQEASGGSAGKLTELLGSVEAVGAAQIIAGTGAEKMAEEMDRQANATGGASDAFETMNATTARTMEQIKVQLQNAAITVGSVLLPPIQRLLSVFLDNLGPAIETVTGFLGGLTDRMGTTGEGVGGLGDTFSAVWKAITDTVGKAVDTVKSIVDDVRRTLDKNADEIRATFETVKRSISAILESAQAIIGGILEAISFLWNAFGDDLIEFTTRAFGGIAKIIEGVLRVIRGVVDTVLGLLTGDWSRAWEGVKAIVSGVWSAIRGLVDVALAALRGIIGAGLSAIAAVFGGVWNSITSGLSGAWNRIVAGVTGGIERLKTSVSTGLDRVRDWFAELPGRIIGALGNVGTMLLDAGRRIIEGLVSGITSRISAVTDAIGGVTSRIRGALPFSPAKWGPLSGRGAPDRAGAKIGEMLAEGMLDSTRAVSRASGRLAGVASIDATGRLGQAASRAGSLAAAGAGTSYTFSGDIVLPNVTDRSTADHLLAGLRQAVRQGART